MSTPKPTPMPTLAQAVAHRLALADQVRAGKASMAPAFTCLASTFGGEHESPKLQRDTKGYHEDDLRLWQFPAPFAIAELSTNPSANLKDLDFRAIIMQLDVDLRRMLIDERVPGDPDTGLPHAWPMRITINNRSDVCAKVDIGRGGDGRPGAPRCVDLWWGTGAWFGVENARTSSWTGLISVEVALPQ